MCFPAEVDTHRIINLPCALLCPEKPKELGKLCEKCKDVFFLYQCDTDHMKLLPMDINTGEHLPIARTLHTLPLRYAQWIQDELEMLEIARIILQCVSPWCSPIITACMKA